jgi:hypothetical protein
MTNYYVQRPDAPPTQNSSGAWATVESAGGVVAQTNAVTTTDNVQATVLSIPVATSKCVIVTAECNCWRAGFASGYGGTVTACFVRGSGNVARSGAQVKNFAGALAVSLDIEANTSTQAADVKVRGEGSQTDVWLVRVYVYTN